jgi:hypothetical protein
MRTRDSCGFPFEQLVLFFIKFIRTRRLSQQCLRVMPTSNTSTAWGTTETSMMEAEAEDMNVMGTCILAGFFAMTFLGVVLLLYLRHRRPAAHQGDEVVAKKVNLPTLEPLVVLLGVIDGCICIFLVVTLAAGDLDNLSHPIAVEATYCGHHFDLAVALILPGYCYRNAYRSKRLPGWLPSPWRC